VDFSYEVSRSLAACEGALLLVDAGQGVEAQTVANATLALNQNLAIIPVINKVDLPGADIEGVRHQIEEILAIPADDAVLASGKTGIGIADMRGVITYANRMMTELLAEGDEAAVVGQHLDAWFDRKAVIDPLLANIRAGEGWTGEQRTMAREKTGWLMFSAVPDINEESELCGMVLSVRDTAERRRAEIAEQQAERNRVMAESLSQACHSLGQPATVLLTGIEILKLEGDKDEALRREMVDLCYGAVIQLRDLLQQMNAKRLQGRGEEKAGEAAPAVSPPPGAADEERVR
jgi:translation elongation factor EF-G